MPHKFAQHSRPEHDVRDAFSTSRHSIKQELLILFRPSDRTSATACEGIARVSHLYSVKEERRECISNREYACNDDVLRTMRIY